MSISTVGPLKDYATLQAWSDAVAFNTGIDEEAECYSGSDLGEWIVDNSFGDYLVNSFTVYAAPGHKHDGTDAGTSGVAHFSYFIGYNAPPIMIQGMRLDISGGAGCQFYTQGVPLGHLTLDGNLIVVADAAPSDSPAAVYAESNDGGGNDSDLTLTARNNVLYWKSLTGSARGFYFFANQNDVGNVTFDAFLFNNTVVSSLGTMTVGYEMRQQGSATFNVEARNNIGLGGTADFATFGTVAFTASNNLSSDATGDDWGASGSLINKSAADVITNASTDATLKAASPAQNAGITVGSFANDVINTARPQFLVWDIGAFESLLTPVGGFRNRFFIEGGSQGNIVGA